MKTNEKIKWVSVSFNYDLYKTNVTRHAMHGNVLRTERVNTGIVNSCQTSIPETEINNALEYLTLETKLNNIRNIKINL